ncbi:hypothetical protein Tco_1377484 [Tanacetum coccineum]
MQVVRFTCEEMIITIDISKGRPIHMFCEDVTLKEILPPAKSIGATFYDHSSNPWLKQRHSPPTKDEKAEFIKTNPTPCQPALL